MPWSMWNAPSDRDYYEEQVGDVFVCDDEDDGDLCRDERCNLPSNHSGPCEWADPTDEEIAEMLDDSIEDDEDV